MIKLFLLLLLLPQQSDSLLDAVNSERGGRHWIDQKPDPAKSPDESLKCFEIEPGSRIELVAAEPLVVDPVWIDFDDRGRMFVTEYSDYPIGAVDQDGKAIEGAKPLSRIVLLEDTNSDGRMDKRTVFADELMFCHSFMPLMDGILACAQSQILFLKDTDGDDVADLREVWFDGFTAAHPQMQIGCPRFGMDNWIYLTYAPGNVVCRRPGFETEKPVKLPRQDMRFHPHTMKFESISGMGQFGNTIDNDGNRFFSTNRNPIMMEIIPQSVASRNPFFSISKRHSDVGPSGGDTRVYPLVDMKSNYLSHAGTHTSACGVTAYRGDLWNNDFQHSVFACEPIGHLVTRTILSYPADSPVLAAKRAREKADFLASSDTWFRPGSLRTGPDGALYVADMYRMWVEHPKFLPPEIAAQIDWREGEDKGRIWRIVPDDKSQPTRSFAAPKNDDDLVAMLRDPNGWRRQTAQRKLCERLWTGKATDAKALGLAELATSADSSPVAKLHALRLLQEYQELTEDVLAKVCSIAIEDQNEKSSIGLRQAIPELLTPWIKNRSSLRSQYSRLMVDPVAAVAEKAVLNLAPSMSEFVQQELTAAYIERPSVWADSWYQDAVCTVIGESPITVCRLLTSPQPTQLTAPNDDRLLLNAARQVAIQGDPAAVGTLIQLLSDDTIAATDAVALALGFQAGAKQNRGKMKYRSLAAVLEAPAQLQLPDTNANAKAIADRASRRLADIATEANDPNVPREERAASLRLMAIVSRKNLIDQLPELLGPKQSAEMQLSVIHTLQEFGIREAVPRILDEIKVLAPSAKNAAISMMLSSAPSTAELLSRMAAGEIPASLVDIDQRVRLLQHRDEKVRKQAGDVFGGVVSKNRKAVADQYQPALTLAASRDRGAAVFEKTCNKCHKIDGKGHNVGPDISDTRRRSRDALLYDILDPNRRVDPQFSEYVVLTVDGLTFNGLLVSDSENEIVLRQPEGKEKTVARSDIEELMTTSKSLMPEGMEKDVTVQQMADLLEFLKVR